MANLWRFALIGQYWFMLAVYVVAGTAKQPQQVVGDYNDLLMHFVGYLVAGISISIAYPRSSWWARAIALWLFSTGIEVIQYFLPWRSFDLWDMLANTAGLIGGLVLALLLKMLVQRFKPIG
ncbi:VanZ family protein [Gilvimarinus agarilyticus]|uniref:VanZ family protein n=1 Tax=unclassified Gilvimarinus TaxID=2642066 RepID=UPI001C09BC57|nr:MULTISPECIES: VanZ family protein [unclassified Gilvimarinus]MBU2884657.1 VanZ family protein [Gilvimarinus agarilyticus]MDO6569764.1 VanZ family protein [Gilvimarinus sp. 2_MG-2023]MDO6747422.1 VanZ family protein [Gilvimarinus sp. 1_MG-2023]